MKYDLTMVQFPYVRHYPSRCRLVLVRYDGLRQPPCGDLGRWHPYTYDNNGNVTAIGSLDYTWDWRNRLASAERSGGGVTSYGYDHTGQWVFKATGTATTSYPSKYYNLATTTGAATATKHIFAPDGTLLATVVGSGVGTATTTYLHLDHLGGTNVATDEDGDVVQTLDLLP
jgi:hypothetical protein